MLWCCFLIVCIARFVFMYLIVIVSTSTGLCSSGLKFYFLWLFLSFLLCFSLPFRCWCFFVCLSSCQYDYWAKPITLTFWVSYYNFTTKFFLMFKWWAWVHKSHTWYSKWKWFIMMIYNEYRSFIDMRRTCADSAFLFMLNNWP